MKKKLKFFKVIHLRDRALLKGRREQKKLDEKLISQIRQEINDEKESIRTLEANNWESKVRSLEKQISEIQEEYSKELYSIRERERNNYEPKLKEARLEIARLNEEDAKRRSQYHAMLQYNIMVERTGEKITDKFNRAGIKLKDFINYLRTAENVFREVTQIIDSCQSDVEATQRVIEKDKPKLLRGLDK